MRRAKIRDDVRRFATPLAKRVEKQLDGAIALLFRSPAQMVWTLLPDGTSLHYFGDCDGLPSATRECVPVGHLIDRDGRRVP